MHRGSTILNVLAILTAFGLAVALLGGRGVIICDVLAERSRTQSTHAAIRTALEMYKAKHGVYPEPAQPGETAWIQGRDIPVGSAHMLYQIVSGDGNNAIHRDAPPGGGVSESDGSLSEDERVFVLNSSAFPTSTIFPKKIPSGTVQARYIVDGWGRPFQYTKADADPSKNSAVNPTYDLWSFGPEKPRNAPDHSLEAKRNPEVSGAWIRNWQPELQNSP